MQTSDKGKLVHIQLEDEEEQNVLRSLIKSSYALAEPKGELNQLIADPCHHMRDSEADDYIMAPRMYDDCVVDISIVNGRECKTRVYRPSSLDGLQKAAPRDRATWSAEPKQHQSNQHTTPIRCQPC